jgi:hypothetical protein
MCLDGMVWCLNNYAQGQLYLYYVSQILEPSHSFCHQITIVFYSLTITHARTNERTNEQVLSCFLFLWTDVLTSALQSLYSHGLRAGEPGFNSWQGWEILFSTVSRPPWGPVSLLTNGCRRLFPRGKAGGREPDHSPPSTADVKNDEAILPLPNTSSWRGARGRLYLTYKVTAFSLRNNKFKILHIWDAKEQ